MAKAKIKMNNAAVVEMLKSPALEAVLLSNAERIAGSAGSGYEAELGAGGRTRSRAFVSTATYEARRDNAKNATLLRALGGG